MSFKTILSATAAAAVLALSANAAMAVTFPDFTVDPNLVPGGSTFVADKIVGGYVEVIEFVGTPLNGTFNYALRWEGGQFFKNNGSIGIAAGITRIGVDYNLYALATGSGTYTSPGFGSPTTFVTNAGGSIQFYYDGSVDTTFDNDSDPLTPGNSITNQATLFARTNFADDLTLLASGSAVSGTGTLDPSLATCSGGGINCGSFGQTSAIELNADGKKFFIDPIPFYNVAFSSGQLNNFDVSNTQVVNGSLDVVFNRVPEPSALALVGLALFGLGLASRRSTKA